MTAKDIQTLCRALYSVPFEELHSLDYAQFSWLRRLNGLGLAAAVDEIRCSLQATQDETKRRNHVVELYSWLAPRGMIHQWDLYRIDRNVEHLEPSSLLDILGAAMEYHHAGSVGRTVDTGDAVYFTLMAKDAQAERLEHTVLCFCIRRGLSYLAAHASGDLLHVPRIWSTLSQALGDWMDSIHGTYHDLSSAFAAIAKVNQEK